MPSWPSNRERARPTVRRRDGATLRPLGLPTPVQVRADEALRPLTLREKGRRPEPVAQIHESWQIDDEWWRQPVSRLYHRVTLAGGRMVTLYRDLEEDCWYLQ